MVITLFNLLLQIGLPLSPPGEPGLTCLTGCCTCLSRAAPMDIGTLKDVHTLEGALMLRYLGLEWVTLTGVALTRGFMAAGPVYIWIYLDTLRCRLSTCSLSTSTSHGATYSSATRSLAL